ncbi:MAG: hypothetical protein HY423_01995 [Candidatus Lambdaproteobacteria bacterium]|nr:hypothetical protein [Candidatus Lambdaproteobacteria bacterium]
MLALALLLLAPLALLVGCSTARQRDLPGSMLASLRQQDGATVTFFREVYRSANLYADFRSVIAIDAIYEGQRYRQLYLKTLGEQFLLDPARLAALTREQDERFENGFEFLVFAAEGQAERLRLERADAAWRFYLRDDDDQVLGPAKVERIRKESTDYQFLERYFAGLDRWSQPYRVSFAKLEKGRLGQPPGKNPFRLVVTGVRGTLMLTWEQPALFYRQAPAPSATP